MSSATSGIFLGMVQDILSWIIESMSTGFSDANVIKYGKLATTSGNFIMNGVWSFIGNAFNAVSSIGMALAVTVFILNLIDLASKDNATFENFVKLILNIIFTIATINMAPQIINVFIGINDTLVDTISKIPVSSSNVPGNPVIDTGLGIVESLVAIVILLIPWLVGLIADLALMFPLISRCLEVAWRCVFFPIGVCNFTGGAQSPAIRYIKNLAATLLVGAFYIVVIKIGVAACMSIIDGLFGTGTQTVIEGFVKITSGMAFLDALWSIIRAVLLIIIIKFATLGVMMSGSRVMKEVIN